jgi:hypothetical protein
MFLDRANEPVFLDFRNQITLDSPPHGIEQLKPVG